MMTHLCQRGSQLLVCAEGLVLFTACALCCPRSPDRLVGVCLLNCEGCALGGSSMIWKPHTSIFHEEACNWERYLRVQAVAADVHTEWVG